MYNIGMTFDLLPGSYPEYKKAHDELWPEMGDAMAANDVNMVIYHYHGRLFLYATAPSKEHLDRSHESPVAQRWLEYMATIDGHRRSGQVNHGRDGGSLHVRRVQVWLNTQCSVFRIG